MDFEELDFLVGNVLTIEGKMNALCIAERNGASIPNSLAVDVLGSHDYHPGQKNKDSMTYRKASGYLDEMKLDQLEVLLRTEVLSRESLARTFVRKNDFRSAARVFQLARDLTSEGIAFEKEGNLFMAMVRYEQAGEFEDAKILSAHLADSPSRTKAYKILESYGKYELSRH